MILCRDVVNVVVKYLEPKCLGSFWRDRGLDWGMKFIYDGSNFPLYWDEIDVCFGGFDGIVLVGIGLYNMIKRKSQLRVNLNKIKYCGLYESNDFVQKRGNLSDLSLLNYLIDVVNVIKLKIVDFYMTNVKILCKFVKLKCLIVEKRKHLFSTFLREIDKCEKLKYLKVVNMMMDCNDFNDISKCRNLVSFYWLGKSSRNCVLECDSLRKFRLVNNNSEDLSIISGCTGLRNVSIKNCEYMNNMFELESCRELRNIVINRCPLLRGWNFSTEFCDKLGDNLSVKYV